MRRRGDEEIHAAIAMQAVHYWVANIIVLIHTGIVLTYARRVPIAILDLPKNIWASNIDATKFLLA